jgi:hypothetical protein
MWAFIDLFCKMLPVYSTLIFNVLFAVENVGHLVWTITTEQIVWSGNSSDLYPEMPVRISAGTRIMSAEFFLPVPPDKFREGTEWFQIIVRVSVYRPRNPDSNLESSYILKSRDSVVVIATGYGLDDRGVGVRVPVWSRIFSSPSRPDRPWGPPSLLSIGYRG